MAFHGKVETQLGQVEYNHSAPQTIDLCGAESYTILLAFHIIILLCKILISLKIHITIYK